MSQAGWPPRIGEVSNGHQWNGSQWVPLAPEVGQVVNDHRWDGRQWVPLALPTPRVGEVANGYQWNGAQWVPLPQPPQVGQVVNGHRWDGRQWVPLGPPPPRVGEVVNGHQWNGSQWVPLQQAVGQPGTPVVMLIPELHRLADAWQFEWSRAADVITLQRVIAEQPASMPASRLAYQARIQADDARREVRFSEALKESGAGPAGGEEETALDGAGVQHPSGLTGPAGNDESIEQQAARFGQKYPLDFRFDLVRDQVRTAAQLAGYGFRYER